MELIKGIFTGDVDLIFGGIKKMFSSVVNAIDNIIKAILEFFGVENFSIIDKVKEIFTKIGDFHGNDRKLRDFTQRGLKGHWNLQGLARFWSGWAEKCKNHDFM